MSRRFTVCPDCEASFPADAPMPPHRFNGKPCGAPLTEEQKLRNEVDALRDEALIAREQGDEEMAKKLFEDAQRIENRLEDLRAENTDHR